MPLSKTLRAKLDAFLATPSASEDGGWAKVGPNDVEQCMDIVRDLLAAKYEADGDGDLPVQVQLVDRTRFEPHPFLLMRRLRDDDTHDLHVVQVSLRTALCNLRLAQTQVEQVQRALDHGVVEPMERGETIFVRQQAFMPRPPEAQLDSLKQALREELAAHLVDQSPAALLEDFTAKQAWTAQVGQALTAKFRLGVQVRVFQPTKDKTKVVVSAELTGLRPRGAQYGPMVQISQTREQVE